MKSVKRASLAEFFAHFAKWPHMRVLLGTSLAWFALDVSFYGINLNQANILNAIGYNRNLSAASNSTQLQYDVLFENACGNLIIACMGTVPGLGFTVFFIERIGRRSIQLMGFVLLAALFASLGFFYEQCEAITWLFLALFTAVQFFHNFGPNPTTFIIPGECFPTRYRSTAHGISSAVGKLGAIVSQGFIEKTKFY